MFPRPIAQAAVTNIKPKRPEKLSREVDWAWFMFKSSIINSQVKQHLDYCLKKFSSYYKPSTPSLFLVFLYFAFLWHIFGYDNLRLCGVFVDFAVLLMPPKMEVFL